MSGGFAPELGETVLYALSTCIWCRKTRRLLDSLGVPYRLVEVDLLSGEEREDAHREVHRWSASGSFPVLVINGKRAIQGYMADRIAREFGA